MKKFIRTIIKRLRWHKDSSVYSIIGKEKGVRQLVERFYWYMQNLPEAKDCLALHKSDLGPVKEKLFMFLTGWFGGPQLFQNKYGHPMMRKRHLPFPIGEKEKVQWMLCMEKALSEKKLKEQHHQSIIHAFQLLADRIQNIES